MTRKALHRRLNTLARYQAAAAKRSAETWQAVDEGHARRMAFLGLVPADLRMAVGIALSTPDGDESLHSWASAAFARWATPPPGFTFPRPLVEWLLCPPRSWFLGHCCERCGLAVPLLVTWSNDPDPPSSIVVFPACPACGGRTTFMAAFEPGGADASLHHRVARLSERLPGPRPMGVPTDPAARLDGLRDGPVRLGDFDRTDADQASAMAVAAAMVTVRPDLPGPALLAPPRTVPAGSRSAPPTGCTGSRRTG